MDINKIYIDSLTKVQLAPKKCMWAGCKVPAFPRLFNLKRHMMCCPFSAEKKMELAGIQSEAMSVQENIKKITQLDWRETYNITNENFGWLDEEDSKVNEQMVLYLEKNYKICNKEKNLVKMCLNRRISQGISPSIKHDSSGKILMYSNERWISNKDDEFQENIDELKEIWFRAVQRALKHWLILEDRNISLITRCYADMDIEYGVGNIREDIKNCYNELTKPGGIIYDDNYS